jgi:3-oxoacyl-(acyl-carrier-protein) synthase
MRQKIAITSLASISPLGNVPEVIWQNYLSDKTAITAKEYNGAMEFVATIPEEVRTDIETLRHSDSKYKVLDETVLMALLVSRQAVKKAGWKEGENFGINIGSSRGATQLFEQFHKEFLETGTTATLTSPTTTLGNVSTWVAHDLKSDGVEISHSITCSTALHALLNAAAWLQSGMAAKFLVGGSEAPLTDFTIAQMKALKIYANQEQDYPCRAFDLEKTKNTMVLGEAASVACLELGQKENALAYITGIGYATDTLEHNISISDEAECFQKSMKMAMGTLDSSAIDAIVMHAPGTRKGDISEYKAIEKVFGKELPMLTTNKWKMGHTFGASGIMSVELAVMMLQHNHFIAVPYAEPQGPKKELKNIMVNAVGFGGNAVSILLSKN